MQQTTYNINVPMKAARKNSINIIRSLHKNKIKIYAAGEKVFLTKSDVYEEKLFSRRPHLSLHSILCIRVFFLFITGGNRKTIDRSWHALKMFYTLLVTLPIRLAK